jgi:uncharacterized membrane protein YgcG
VCLPGGTATPAPAHARQARPFQQHVTFVPTFESDLGDPGLLKRSSRNALQAGSRGFESHRLHNLPRTLVSCEFWLGSVLAASPQHAITRRLGARSWSTEATPPILEQALPLASMIAIVGFGGTGTVLVVVMVGSMAVRMWMRSRRGGGRGRGGPFGRGPFGGGNGSNGSGF